MAHPNRPGEENNRGPPNLFDENGNQRRRQEEDLHPSPLADSRQVRPPPGANWTGPPQIGRADLDPLAGGGAGMIFDPRNPQHHPPQHHPLQPNPGQGWTSNDPFSGIPAPPGARFDPFSPLDPPPPDSFGRGRGGYQVPRRGGRRPGEPNNDHMTPPGYDDMFG